MSKKTDAVCPVFGKCGACQTLNLDYEEELSLKMKREITLLKKYGRIEEIIPSPAPEGKRPLAYRNKAQYLFQFNGGRISMGLYRASDGGITRLERCPMESPELFSVAKTVRKMIEPYGVKVWDGRRGSLRHVMIRRAFGTGEMLCALVTRDGLFEGAQAFAEELTRRHPALKSVSVIRNDTDIPLFMNGEEYVLHGSGSITDELCGCRFEISAKSFYQINPPAVELLYRKAAEFAGIKEGDRVLDAYCGIGTVGITAVRAAGVKDVILEGFDVSEDAVRNAGQNARKNGIGYAAYRVKKDGFFSLKKEEGAYDVIFVDPPRAGCDRRFLNAVMEASPKRFVYISCDPESLARDLAVLKPAFRAEAIQPVDLFPGTGHVETVCSLIRRE